MSGPVHTPFEDEDTGPRTLNELRLWYRDSDGLGANANVRAQLQGIDGALGVLPPFQQGATLNSSSNNVTAQTTLATPLNGVNMRDAQYFVVITLTRTSLTAIASFRGVSFFQEP